MLYKMNSILWRLGILEKKTNFPLRLRINWKEDNLVEEEEESSWDMSMIRSF